MNSNETVKYILPIDAGLPTTVYNYNLRIDLNSRMIDLDL